MLLLPKFLAGFSGHYVDSFGYAQFFVATALLGLPVLGLIMLAMWAGLRTTLDRRCPYRESSRYVVYRLLVVSVTLGARGRPARATSTHGSA